MPRREWFWWKRTYEVLAVPEEECCARPGAVPHNGECRWCARHSESSSVEHSRDILQSSEYEDYSTDSRLSAMLKRNG